jgi:uncharacterized membrane protein YuzA (DUF378 family)
MKNLNAFDWVAFIVLIIGGINWGIISIFNMDLVSTLLGVMTLTTRIIYGLVGLSAVYMMYVLSAKAQ